VPTKTAKSTPAKRPPRKKATLTTFDAALIGAARDSKAWPFEEARRLIERQKRLIGGEGKTVVFQTGYGPSGLPHIGTFGEVARTSMVRKAFALLTEGKVETRLISFSDDMDGLRKVPDNVPNKDMLAEHLQKPLTAVPDPFGTHDSFGAHNNARLKDFLNSFGFDYEFLSATECYRQGLMDEALLRMLDVYDKVMDIILPTLGPDRRATYSPFLPISPETGRVLYVPMVERNTKTGTVVYIDPDSGKRVETKVTGGAVKCQWKADWALRWTALGVDYEMAGKDLIDSVKLSGQICRALGGIPPEGFNFELFLDEKGQKISKSKGNGLTAEEWLRYASPESLSLFMYQKPREAKRLYFDVIPRAVDDYLQFLAAYERQEAKDRLGNPVWHIHSGAPPKPEVLTPPAGSNVARKTEVSFALLLNLVSVAHAEDKERLWAYLSRYAPGVSAKTHPRLDALVGYAIRYYDDFVKPAKKYRPPDEKERAAFLALRDAFAKAPKGATAEDLQNIVYEIGKTYAFEPLRDWFKALYEVLLGQSQGPRFGSFAELYGVDETCELIDRALAGRLG
jgi:lysyl-tRNA synthetase class 1